MFLRFRTTCAALLAGSMLGCTTYRSKPLDPAAEIDRLRQRDLFQFVVERERPGQGGVPSPGNFDPSDGLDEREVVAVALTLNPELRARRAAVGEARAALITAGLWPNPEVSISPKVGIDGASGFSLEADALFQLLRPGERQARKRAAISHVEEVRAEVVADEFKLVSEVRAQRLAVLAADRTVALLEEGVRLRERALDLVRQRRRLGEGTELDISATELELAESRRDLRQAQGEQAGELRELNRVVGLPTDYALKLTGVGEPLTVTVFEDVPDDELDRRVVAGRMELRAKEAEYRRAEQELRVSVLQQFPRLGVGPAFEKELEGDKALGLELGLELPLFNQNQGEIAEKRAARERTRAEYVALLHRLRSQALAARAAVRTAKQEVEVQEKEILPLVKRNQELFEGAFRARELNIIDWITAQQRAVDARQEYLKALVRYRRAVIELESAVGEPLSTPTTTSMTRPS